MSNSQITHPTGNGSLPCAGYEIFAAARATTGDAFEASDMVAGLISN